MLYLLFTLICENITQQYHYYVNDVKNIMRVKIVILSFASRFLGRVRLQAKPERTVRPEAEALGDEALLQAELGEKG